MSWLPKLPIPAWLYRVIPVARPSNLPSRPYINNGVAKQRPRTTRGAPVVATKTEITTLDGPILRSRVGVMLRQLATNEVSAHETEELPPKSDRVD